ncbi:zinc finger protein 888-like isoform X2 [Chrysoperla carnea]|uniref:zinc finger protein 888-like isoform X2 n=1 Tax=Chrysoperla carnea TaxID=189513 RepID=UPI001D08FCE3|nr:zinc finger protein 888-like isoform X2 [Chrysoperla carnea]
MDIKCVSVTDFEKIWENDELPNQICNGCFVQLQNTISFKQLCENSDNEFRQIIKKNKFDLSNNEDNCANVKEEGYDSIDYDDNNSLSISIKEENILENITNQNPKFGYNEDNVKKSESINNEDREMLEIKNEDGFENNRRQTRRKIIQFKFEEDSDSHEDINEKNDSDWEGEDRESDKDQSQPNEYKCETCSAIFKRVEALGLHMKIKHNAEGTKCYKCSLICYHKLHLNVHEKSHNKCRFCNLTFSSKKKLTEHKLTHDVVINKSSWECKECPAIFSSRDTLYRHMKMIHNRNSIKKLLICDKCDEKFPNKRLLARHIRKTHPKEKKEYKKNQIVNCEICGKTLKRCYLSKHMTTHGERNKLACEYCPKIFISQETLQTHVKIYHKNSGPVCKFLCSECGLKLRSKAELSNHLITHTGERPYACDKCDKTYRTTFMLKQHISRTHLNERNFICTFCSQAFFDKKILLNHVRRHTGEKPFKCNMCEKRFIQKTALKVHMKVHTGTAEYNFNEGGLWSKTDV